MPKKMNSTRFVIRRGIAFFLCAALFLSVPVSVAQTLFTQFGSAFGEENMGSSIELPASRSETAGQTLQNDRSRAGEGAAQISVESRERNFLPAAPSDFQRFIASSTGSLLPIFGASFFETAFPSVAGIPVPSDYIVGPDDEIILRVWGQQNFEHLLTVDRNGEVFIPQVGGVTLAGLQYRELPGFLKAQLGRVFKGFEIGVGMGRLRSIQIYVAGNAVRTGIHTVSSLDTMVNALFVSGGPLPNGSMRRIQLRRNGQLVTELDLYDLLLRGDKTGDARLQPEDVVFIPPVGPQVAATGSVKKPAVYEIKNEKTVGEVIEMTGGFSPIANRERATIERIRGGISREVIDLFLNDTGMRTPIADGDLIQALTIVPRFDDTVTLRGNVANPGRFTWRPGMRLRDIIPDKESLITRDYWKQRNLLGNIPNETRDLWNDVSLGNASVNDPPSIMANIVANSAANSMANSPLDASANYSPNTEKPLLDLDYFTKRELEARLRPEERMEMELRAEAAAKPERIRVESPVADIYWAYAVIERQNPADLLTNLIPFNLGKLVLENDESQNLEIRSGDVVTIFSQSDILPPQMQQTRTIKLEGEFNAPGIYPVAPGETLGHLFAKAGGLTPQAYLFGTEFTRESTRRDQQRRMERYVMELEQSLESAARNRMANASDSGAVAGISMEVENQKRAIEQIRLMRSTGRIVLNLQPDSNNFSEISGLTLENGDVFMVPPRPSVVNVIGEVYNPNSFIYDGSRQVDEYLKIAGGYTRSADKNRAYIIRADGSVLPRQSVKNFSRLKLNPGDSLVVPEYLMKMTFLRGLRDWSQVISQFGLGVAAINVLR